MTQRQLNGFIIALALFFAGFFLGYAIASKHCVRDALQLIPMLEPGDCEWPEFACAAGEPCDFTYFRPDRPHP